MAYFGYPQAQEDDAEQAVRAGLAVVGAVSEIDAVAPLKVRVGIATGLAIVGDVVGNEMSEVDAISGDTPNLAARLQAFAGANMVVIGERTYALLSRAFECEPLGAQQLKGVEEPFKIWRVVEERHLESRFETRHTGVFTPFVGRRDELDLLTRRWDRRSIKRHYHQDRWRASLRGGVDQNNVDRRKRSSASYNSGFAGGAA